jgi:hypothetical protein
MDIPTIDDFDIELQDRIVVFTGNGGEKLAWFPEWEDADRDLRHFGVDDVPFGTIDEPFEDAGDAWRIVIYEDEGFVYVFEGDSPSATDFPRRFRVPRDRYFESWALVLTRFNPVLPLDE